MYRRIQERKTGLAADWPMDEDATGQGVCRVKGRGILGTQEEDLIVDGAGALAGRYFQGVALFRGQVHARILFLAFVVGGITGEAVPARIHSSQGAS